MAVPLQTSRLGLRPLVEADRDFYCRLYADPVVTARVGPPLSPEAARGAFDRVLRQVAADPPRAHYWMLCERATQAVIGLMALVFDRGDRTSAEVGVLLLPDAQGQGHGSEAIATLVDRASTAFGISRLWARHAPDNAAMARLLRDLGFSQNTDFVAARDVPAMVHWQLLRMDSHSCKPSRDSATEAR